MLAPFALSQSKEPSCTFQLFLRRLLFNNKAIMLLDCIYRRMNVGIQVGLHVYCYTSAALITQFAGSVVHHLDSSDPNILMCTRSI